MNTQIRALQLPLCDLTDGSYGCFPRTESAVPHSQIFSPGTHVHCGSAKVCSLRNDIRTFFSALMSSSRYFFTPTVKDQWALQKTGYGLQITPKCQNNSLTCGFQYRHLIMWQNKKFLSNYSDLYFKQQPMRSKHCQTCQHCVRRYDHHCPWIENCVGERNHRWFVLYLAVQLLVLLWGLHIAWWVPHCQWVCPYDSWCHHSLLPCLFPQDGFQLRSHLGAMAAH